MNSFLKMTKQAAQSFARDEEGAQIVEYGLIIAVVSVVLIVALKTLTGTGSPFNSMITHVTNCLSGTSCP